MEAGGSQNAETGNGGAVKPLQPKVRRSSVSSLSGRKIEQRMTEKRAVELDLLRPESSARLKGIFEQTRSGDLETRFCALWRFKDVYINMVVAKGSTLATSFAAYLLEQGILQEIIRILDAAQADGDWYSIPRLGTGYTAISKVGVCLRIVQLLMLDARTVRFVRKAIPDLLSIAEGVYFAKPVTAGEPAARGLATVPSYRQEEDKMPALGILLQLSVWSKQTRPIICNRIAFLRGALRDCMSGSDFARDMIERVIMTFTSLLETCDLASLLDELLDVCFSAFETAQRREVLVAAVHLLQSVLSQLKLQPKENLLGLSAKAQSKKDWYTMQLLAAATCPGFMLEYRPMFYVYLSIFHAPFRPFLINGAPGQCTPAQDQELQRYLAANPAAVARRRQICNILAAKPPANVQEKSHHFSPHLGPATAPKQAETSSAYVHKPIKDPLGAMPAIHTYWYGDDVKPQRKCSHSSCSLIESASRRFKICSGCRLAVYCSQDCQKAAWKEGHKSRCRTGSKDGGNR
ncbi:hypothetical protein KFL_000690175 [Klebsormidium nitens]|uniref:MYND-type domain-containing protein n=1 Tax=Klebsormidium nitens TaxID=105231 RepID=A0A1Y1HYU8_KLENI|nr:hypothetical protein KFL_000690175 [Klebsormidium nitens]|eukprot:GAQ81038.1 hypothetical protein KFL_000690175 [Klebsormidium nitens]